MINTNTNTLSKKKGLPYPTADLSFLWLGGYDGTSLLNLKGANPTYVSGSGLDAIYDFSVLNDDRFDKGARVGNALGLPEYYNDPLNAYFYYDGTSETTRRYWKLKDFHYFYLQQQTDITPRLFNNEFFLKATATTDTSNVIDSIDALYIYSTEQTDANLTKLKAYIGIQDDFYGDELLLDTGLDVGYPNWTNLLGTGPPDANWTISGGSAVSDGNNGFMGQRTTLALANKTYKVEVNINSLISGVLRVRVADSTYTYLSTSGVKIIEIESGTVIDETILFYSQSLSGSITFASLKQKFVNYYSS